MNKLLHSIVLNKIVTECRRKFTLNDFRTFKTISGLTQSSERIYKPHIRAIISELGYDFVEAASQQSADFRITLAKNNTMFF